MPLYELHCASCNEIQEHLLKMNEELPSCEKCGDSLKKILSKSNIRMAGAGLYSIDYTMPTMEDPIK